MKYADQRGAPLVVIQGGDEKAKGEVQIKDLRLGAELAKGIDSREEYKERAWRRCRCRRRIWSRRSKRRWRVVTSRFRHPGESRDPSIGRSRGDWTPAFAGVTDVSRWPVSPRTERAALERSERAIMAVFERAGFDYIAPDIIQPADIFLERSGEDIRARTFVFTDPTGAEMCLQARSHRARLPLSPDAMRAKPDAESRYCYLRAGLPLRRRCDGAAANSRKPGSNGWATAIPTPPRRRC